MYRPVSERYTKELQGAVALAHLAGSVMLHYYDLEYRVDGGAITISTREELQAREEPRMIEGPTVTRVYDVRDLIDGAAPAKWEKTLIRELIAEALRDPMPKPKGHRATQGDQRTLADAYRGRIDELATAIAEELREQRVRHLLDAMWSAWPRHTYSIDPPIESMREFNGQLIIRNTPELHRRAARLLSVLRRQAAPMRAQAERDDEPPGATTRPAK